MAWLGESSPPRRRLIETSVVRSQSCDQSGAVVPDKNNGLCQGPEVGMSLLSLMTRQKNLVRGKVVGTGVDEVREESLSQISKSFVGRGMQFGFYVTGMLRKDFKLYIEKGLEVQL